MTKAEPLAPSLEALIALRYPVGEWAVVYELAQGTGFRGQNGRIDAAAFGCWPSKGFLRVACEVKRSRGDFLRELDKPAKRAFAEQNFHQTYFVVPHGLVKPEEVPESWGLLVASQKGDKLRRVKVAMDREVSPMPESLALAAIRALASRDATRESRHFNFEGETVTHDQLDALVEERANARVPGLERKRTELRQAEQSLADARRRLHEPLVALAEAAMARDGGLWPAERAVAASDLDVATVRRWIQSIGAAERKRMLRSAQQAHDALGRLLEESDA